MDCYLIQSSQNALETLAETTVDPWALVEQIQQSGKMLNLGEAWTGIHFVISGEVPTLKYEALEKQISWSDESLENVLMGGQPIAAEASFGAVRLLFPPEVKFLSAKLATISAMQLSQWYDPQELTEYRIPPAIWQTDPNALTWLSSQFQRLCALYQSAAEAGDGFVMYIL